MATNGDLNNSNSNCGGRTENDATHIRFRDDRHPEEFITCLSCGERFLCTSQLNIYEHYSEKEHTRYFGDCLYCAGKVHQYSSNNNTIKIYHNCFRWKQGEDK